jgi:hypothetical protein
MVENFGKFLKVLAEFKMSHHFFAARPANALAQCGVADQALELFRKFADIASGDQKAALIVFNELRDPIDRTADAR